MKTMRKTLLALVVMAWMAPLALANPAPPLEGGINMGKGGGKPTPTPVPPKPTPGPPKSGDE